MTWRCPDDWKCVPEMVTASENTLFAILFGDHKRFQNVRNIWFRRCNASGKWIWPLQKAWVGVVSIKTANEMSPGSDTGKGSYVMAWLNEDQYIVQKLKGNI